MPGFCPPEQGLACSRPFLPLPSTCGFGPSLYPLGTLMGCRSALLFLELSEWDRFPRVPQGRYHGLRTLVRYSFCSDSLPPEGHAVPSGPLLPEQPYGSVPPSTFLPYQLPPSHWLPGKGLCWCPGCMFLFQGAGARIVGYLSLEEMRGEEDGCPDVFDGQPAF